MVEPTFRGGDVALFIDWENFKISLAAGNRAPNLSSLKEEIAEQGRMVVAKAYADWVTRAPELRGASQFINDPPSLYAAGIEPVFVPSRVPSPNASSANGMRTYRVKNSVDVKMTADCIECAHSYPNIATFVLVSGDSDFLHVVNALRTMGKRVVIIGVSWSTSRRLADQVDSLLLYDKDIDPPPAPAQPQPAVLPQHATRRGPQDAAAPDTAPELAQIVRAIEEIIRDERAAGGNPLLTSIKQRLMRRYPGFDEKKLGFSGFKKLMARAAEDGNIKLIHAGLVDWAIMADEETPESATEETPSGVAAKPSRRRGGRRRHSQHGAETPDTDDADDDAPESPDGQPALPYAESPEETAATDFDAPDPESPWTTLTPARANTTLTPANAGPTTPTDGVGATLVVAHPPAAAQPADNQPPENPFGNDPDLADALRDALTATPLPTEPEDNQNPERVSDLIVMAHTLEHRQGVSHVAFNFLVAEICTALEQGLAADNTEIAQRWSSLASRDYLSKMLRGLSDGDFFRRSTHSWRDEASGRRRQRRTFNLNRENQLVSRMLTARLGPAAIGQPPNEPTSGLPTDEPDDVPATTAATVADAAAIEPPANYPTNYAQPQPQPTTPEPDAATPDAAPTAPPEDPGEPQPLPDEPQPPLDDLPDEFDEPQPRTVRRRPFTSRLLRS